MDRKIIVIVLLLLFNITVSFASSLRSDSPIGYWKTIDDVTGQPRSIIQIWKTNDQTLMGKVIKIFSKNSLIKPKVCTACKGDKHNQPILGMVVMSGLKLQQNQWKKGQILDPENGKTYQCVLKLTENGKKLNVHGYVGLPIFGRSQTWERVDLMSG